MQVISVIGASGFIGHHLLSLLAEIENLEIRVLVHRKKPQVLEKNNVRLIKGSLLQVETLEQLLEPGCIVLNLVYIASCSELENLEAMGNLARACANRQVKRLVHCSTAVVVGDVAENIINEDTQCNPSTPYEKTKLEMEHLLLNKAGTSFEVTVLRPTAVFGAQGQNLVKLADNLTQGSPIINYFKSSIFNKRSLNLVCVDNVVAAMVFLGETDRKVDKEVFIISDDNAPCNNYLDVKNLLIKKLLLKVYPMPLIRIPSFLLGAVLKLVGKPQSNPLVKYSDQKLISFGFIKPIGFEQGVNKFVDWYRSNENT